MVSVTIIGDPTKFKKFIFNGKLEFTLKNYADKSIHQTMLDSEKHNDSPFQIIKKPLFKADKHKRKVDELSIDYSPIIETIYRLPNFS